MNNQTKILLASFAIALVLLIWTPWQVSYQGVYRNSNGGKFEYSAYYKRHPYWQKDSITQYEMEGKLPKGLVDRREINGFVCLEVDWSRLAVEYSILVLATLFGLYLEKTNRKDGTHSSSRTTMKSSAFVPHIRPLIHVFQDNQQMGAFTEKQIQTMLDIEVLTLESLAWKEGMAKWAPLRTVLTPTPRESFNTPPPIMQEEEPVSLPPPIPSEAMGPKGVGGVLLIFCIGLTILSPLFTIGQIYKLWEHHSSFHLLPHIKHAVVWATICSVLLLVYSFVIGCIIWRGHPNGKSIAKTYLIIRLCAFIVVESVSSVLLCKYTSEIVITGMDGLYGSALRELCYFLIWWFYFKTSKRVHNTYQSPSLSETTVLVDESRP